MCINTEVLLRLLFCFVFKYKNGTVPFSLFSSPCSLLFLTEYLGNRSLILWNLISCSKGKRVRAASLLEDNFSMSLASWVSPSKMKWLPCLWQTQGLRLVLRTFTSSGLCVFVMVPSCLSLEIRSVNIPVEGAVQELLRPGTWRALL